MTIYTLRYGDLLWLRVCSATLNAWCKRHALPLKVFSTWNENYPSSKFCEVDMLKDFLAGDDDWMMYVDADVVVNNNAPAPSFSPGFHIRSDQFQPMNRTRWGDWCEKHFGKRPLPDVPYRNAGVWACDRESAQRMLDVISEPYHLGVMEQHHWNWWVMLAEGLGMKTFELSRLWNSFPRDWQPAWFYHIYGNRKEEWLRQLKRRNLIMQPPIMKRTSTSRILAAAREPKWPMFMDQHHVNMLDSLISKHKPRVAIEIGSHKGVSTQPFLDAVSLGIIEILHLIEPSPTEELIKRIASCAHPKRVHLHRSSSWELNLHADFAFIDGDHRWPALADLSVCLAQDISVIAMHDTKSFDVGIASCWGSTMAANILKAAPGRAWAEDCQERPEMWTQRGFGWSVKK